MTYEKRVVIPSHLKDGYYICAGHDFCPGHVRKNDVVVPCQCCAQGGEKDLEEPEVSGRNPLPEVSDGGVCDD